MAPAPAAPTPRIPTPRIPGAPRPDVIDKELLEILACPETHQRLALASPEVLSALNERVRAGGVRNVGGEAVGEELDGGLVREDGTLVYPIRDEIPVLLIDEGIRLAGE